MGLRHCGHCIVTSDVKHSWHRQCPHAVEQCVGSAHTTQSGLNTTSVDSSTIAEEIVEAGRVYVSSSSLAGAMGTGRRKGGIAPIIGGPARIGGVKGEYAGESGGEDAESSGEDAENAGDDDELIPSKKADVVISMISFGEVVSFIMVGRLRMNGVVYV
jgi:hypothetical protein